MTSAPSPLRTLRIVAQSYLPRVFQTRGWVLAALPMVPITIALVVASIVAAQTHGSIPPTLALNVFHGPLLKLMVPLMALVAAPAGLREDLEQRTLPLMLVRPAPIWILPLAKGSLWFLWGALWLLVASLGLGLLNGFEESLFRHACALVSLYWAELAFMTFLGLLLKRGNLWGALYLFAFDPLVGNLPGNLQRMTFLHYAESIAGSRSNDIKTQSLLAQAQMDTPFGIALLVLVAFGLTCWVASGWKVYRTPIGLAGSEAEG